MYCHTLVSPGIGATVQTFFFRTAAVSCSDLRWTGLRLYLGDIRVLMIEDFPVFGYPMKPTEICFRFECKLRDVF